MRKSLYYIAIVFCLFAASAVGFPARAQDTGRGQAIGIRIIPNPDRLSPLTWYRANVPNPGNPAALEVDGYPAVRDGRSVYVAATNYDANSRTLYSNIYLISYSETADESVQAVFNEFLRQFRLNTNITDRTTREQIRRDMHRAADLNNIQGYLESYRVKTGKYPVFEAGSYLPNTTYSTWPSWQATLGNLLGVAVPVDPRNEFIGCKDPYDTKTCWSVEDRQFSCPPEAYAYAYRVNPDGLSYNLFTNFEYQGPGSWRTQSFSDQTAGQCFNFSAADSADFDGDGVGAAVDNCPAVSNADQSDSDSDGVGNACDTCPNDPTNDQDNDGVCGNLDNCPTIGNSDQTDLDGDGVGDVCDFQTCGNNVTEGTEACDGQSGVNEFQECAADCRSVRSVAYCGDGTVQTPNEQGLNEECDGNNETQLCSTFINGYRTQRVRVCRNTCRYAPWTDCQPIETCGDGIINGLETCDESEQNGVQCQAAYAQRCTYCSSVCKVQEALGPRCGDGIVQADQGEECDESNKNGQRCVPAYGKTCNYCTNSCKIDVVRGPYCGDGARNIPFEACDNQTQDVPCEPEPTYFYKLRRCVQEATPQNPLCTWGPYDACRQVGFCGDGTVNGPEKCDDAKTPGLCQSCQVANNKVTASYAVVADTRKSFCVANKGAWGWSMADTTSEELQMTCTGASSQSFTRNGQSFGSPWGWPYNASHYKLPYPLMTDSVTWFHGGCGGHFMMGRYNGQEVRYQTYFIPKHGEHCGNDNAMHRLNLSDAVIDEVVANETWANGGYARGRIYLPNAKEIDTNGGIVVLEHLRDRRDPSGNLLPQDTYRVNFQQGQGFMVWLGNSTKTDPSQGQTSTTSNTTYVLGCVDVDNNRVCDFLQAL